MIKRYGNGHDRNRGTLPVMQHHPKMTVRQGTVESAMHSQHDHPMSCYNRNNDMHQSAALLPFEFDKFLDGRVANEDTFYALHYIFQYVAFAEVQVLNLLEAQLEREMGVLTVERDQSHSLENLQFFSMFLDRHVRHISEALQVVKAKGHTRWPAKTDVCETSESAAKSIEEDFEQLWERALDLRRRCTEGMGVMMNRAVIAESRKAIDQAERLKRLTLLATFFIPLSFTTSLFGMNFKEFGQGQLSAWLFAVVSAPVLILSYCAYVWDDRFNVVYHTCLAWTGRHLAKRKWASSQAV
jgi:Mg2+ and Co2+ transporter CorA